MMKDWITYIDEFNKVKAWEITGMSPDKVNEIKATIREVGFTLICYVASGRESGAIDYAEQVL